MNTAFFKQRKNQKNDIREISKKLSVGLAYIEKRDKLFSDLDVYGEGKFKKYVASIGMIASTICFVAKTISFIFLGFAVIIGLAYLLSTGDKETAKILLIIEAGNISIIVVSVILIMLFSEKRNDYTMYESLLIRNARNRVRQYSLIINKMLFEIPPFFRNKKAIVKMIELVNGGEASSLNEAVDLYENYYCKNKSFKQLNRIKNQLRSETIGGN